MKSKFAVLMAGVMLALSSGSSLADPPHRNDHRGDYWGDYRSDHRHETIRVDFWPRFTRDDRIFVRDYYQPRAHRGFCPPGLAKKNNGCMPRGQARKWRLGEPLPQRVIYYELPHDVVVRLGPPPRGYRYVRVDNDILLLAIGTGLVLDAIENLGRH